MKTNKITQPARKNHAPRPTRFEMKRNEPRPDPQRDHAHDFLALCFYPGMKAVDLPLVNYPTAV